MPTSGYGYFPGCLLRGTAVAYEESLLALFRLLGLPLEELRDWNCCGATSYMSIDEDAAFVLSARNLSLAGQAKVNELVTPCSACYLVLRKTQEYVERYPQVAHRVEHSIGAEGLSRLQSVRVRHPLEVLYADVKPEEIRARVVRPWRGGTVACYYGCQLVRRYYDADRPHNPVRLDHLLHAAGVPTVEFPLKTKCCGGSLTGTTHPVGVRLDYILLKEAQRRGARSIATICPLCQYNLDAFQGELRRETHEWMDMPVLFFTQILGWVLGADARALGLGRSISGRDAIERWCPSRPEKTETYV